MLSAAMGQRKFGYRIYVVHRHSAVAVQRRVGAGCTQHDQIGPHAIHPGHQRQLGGMVQNRIGPM